MGGAGEGGGVVEGCLGCGYGSVLGLDGRSVG